MMMLPLLRSDVYRLVRSTYFWVVTVVSVAICAGIALMGAMLDEGAGAGRTWPTHVDMLSDTLLSVGLLSIFVAILSVRIASEDVERGFVKNLFAGRPRRTVYYMEKLTLIAVAALWLMAVNIAVMEAAFALMGYRYVKHEPWGGTVLYVALMALGTFALGAVTAAITWLIRSRAFAMTAGVLVAMGTVSSVLGVVAGLLSSKAPWLFAVQQSMLTSALSDLGRQPGNLFITLGVGGPTGLLPDLSGSAPTWGWPLWVYALFHFVLWIVLATGVTLLTNRRRDMC